ncbi:MAG: hypothetical protein NZ700_16810 [Gemmataceae bacterium]|nr:hypothetical protein [Gemmataceae bacterium]MDW8266432.1 hypothetical protein [Gemmataceae bacterium]
MIAILSRLLVGQPRSPLWAGGFYQDFIAPLFNRQDRMIMVAVLVGCLALFIITRGKWR